jgi:hypothetical protein
MKDISNQIHYLEKINCVYFPLFPTFSIYYIKLAERLVLNTLKQLFEAETPLEICSNSIFYELSLKCRFYNSFSYCEHFLCKLINFVWSFSYLYWPFWRLKTFDYSSISFYNFWIYFFKSFCFETNILICS